MSDAVMQQHDFQVLSAPEHVSVARRETAKVLGAWGLAEETVEIARLIVSELVTNVVRHAALLSPTAAVSLCHDGSHVTLSVADRHPHKPKALQAAYGVGGRGLYLVRTLVEEVGGSHDVLPDRNTGGKSIVIRLPAPVPARAGSTRRADLR